MDKGQERRIQVYLAKEAQYQQINEEKEAEYARRKRDQAMRREAQFAARMKEVTDGMEGRLDHLTLATKHIEFQESWRQQKRKDIHREWEKGVYSKIAQASIGRRPCSASQDPHGGAKRAWGPRTNTTAPQRHLRDTERYSLMLSGTWTLQA